ncbi:MAG: ABC transporter ATP-binding protein [Bacteroidota bacterium]|jgi:ABC-type lipoprotein export system ATPase subunit
MIVLETQSLKFSYPNGREFHFPDLKINSNSECLILGDSGVGKTTLLHILGGMLKPSSGEVILNKQSLYQLKGPVLDQFRGSNLGVIFQTSHFVQPLSVLENVNLAVQFVKMQSEKNRAEDLLERLGLSDKKNKLPKELSVGEQQRVGIARALMAKPQIILADEPTSALDDSNANIVIDLLREESKRSNSALIIVTHDSRLKSVIQETVLLKEAMK